MACLHGWHGQRACVGDMLARVTWVACLRGWRACVVDVLAWVPCLRGLRASVGSVGGAGGVLVWVAYAITIFIVIIEILS